MIFNKLLSILGGVTLRNRPGGLAMIRTRDGSGAEALNGRIVTTVRADAHGFWIIEPPQSYVTSGAVILWGSPHVYPAGTTVRVGSVRDAALKPLRDPGAGERDESAAWLPPVPTKQPAKV